MFPRLSMFVDCSRFVSYKRLLVENVGFADLLIRTFVFLANQAIHTLTFNKHKPCQTCLLTIYVCLEQPLMVELVFLAWQPLFFVCSKPRTISFAAAVIVVLHFLLIFCKDIVDYMVHFLRNGRRFFGRSAPLLNCFRRSRLQTLIGSLLSLSPFEQTFENCLFKAFCIYLLGKKETIFTKYIFVLHNGSTSE